MTLALRQSFGKAEKLKSKKIIEELFVKGSSFYLYPLKVLFLVKEDYQHAYPQVLISVSKRKFKKAVDRNKIKRQIREAYRKNKSTFFKSIPIKSNFLGFIYVADKTMPFQELEKKLIFALERLKNI